MEEENPITDNLGDSQKDTDQDQSAKKPSVQKKKAATLFHEESRQKREACESAAFSIPALLKTTVEVPWPGESLTDGMIAGPSSQPSIIIMPIMTTDEASTALS